MSIFRRIFTRRADDAPQRLPSPDELVLLTSAETDFEATLFRDMLEEAGITALVKNRDALSVNFHMPAPAYSRELWVLRKDLRRAREVLELTES